MDVYDAAATNLGLLALNGNFGVVCSEIESGLFAVSFGRTLSEQI
jgi:hypothetical protein